ncbi:hypothetical protein TRIUR3_27843 [Triticum urartu]|uniref:Uncharacterized protein n=1 Tax=Triticum urartu TaxID=4572 RepID=M7ZWZ3_TRIUA|nr:hypothetical protein TRIUR3_27843 [Triticum urartu]
MQEAGSERDLQQQRQRQELGTVVSRGMGRLEATTSGRKTGDAAAGTGRRGSDGQGRRRGAEGRDGDRSGEEASEQGDKGGDQEGLLGRLGQAAGGP